MRSAVRRAQAPERNEDAPISIGEIRCSPRAALVTSPASRSTSRARNTTSCYYLMTHAGRAVTYGKLLTSVWGPDYRQEVDYLRTFIRQLRKKIETDPSDPRYLLTDAYVGYRFAEIAGVRPAREPSTEGERPRACEAAHRNT